MLQLGAYLILPFSLVPRTHASANPKALASIPLGKHWSGWNLIGFGGCRFPSGRSLPGSCFWSSNGSTMPGIPSNSQRHSVFCEIRGNDNSSIASNEKERARRERTKAKKLLLVQAEPVGRSYEPTPGFRRYLRWRNRSCAAGPAPGNQ